LAYISEPQVPPLEQLYLFICFVGFNGNVAIPLKLNKLMETRIFR